MSTRLLKAKVVHCTVRIRVPILDHLCFRGTPLLSPLGHRVVGRDIAIRLIDVLILKLILELILTLMLILGLMSSLNLIWRRILIVSMNGSVFGPSS